MPDKTLAMIVLEPLFLTIRMGLTIKAATANKPAIQSITFQNKPAVSNDFTADNMLVIPEIIPAMVKELKTKIAMARETIITATAIQV